MDIDHGQLVYPSLEDVAIVMDLHELAPVGGRSPGRRDGWWLERFAEVCQHLPDRRRFRDECGLKARWAEAMGFGGIMFWDITSDATDSPESLVKAAYDSWVLGEDLATIRSRSRLTNEIIVGGDGVIGPLPLFE